MDKDLLRIVIISIGAVVILGMVIWSIVKNKNTRRDIDFYDKGNPLDNIDSSLILSTENDDFLRKILKKLNIFIYVKTFNQLRQKIHFFIESIIYKLFHFYKCIKKPRSYSEK